MYTAPFRYLRATSLADAESLFASTPDAKYIAGGQTLIPTMKQRLAAPPALIDLSRIAALSFIRRANAMLVIGDPAVRHRGTLGGSVANNDPAADYPAAVLALGATVKTTRRTIAADAFFTGLFQTALDDGELIAEIAFPIPARAGYAKFPHPASRYALVGVFVAQFPNAVRVVVTGAGPGVFRVATMEQALSKSFTPDSVASIRIAPDALNSDLFGSAEYRAHLVTVMAKRAVAAALG